MEHMEHMDGRKGPCGVVNFYCDDGKHPHPPNPDCDECCDPCKANKRGMSFVAPLATAVVAQVGVEIPMQLLYNPAGSGKNLHINSRLALTNGSDDNGAVFKYYFDPQLNAPGVPEAVVCMNVQTPAFPASMAQAYSAPSVASNGIIIDGITVAVDESKLDNQLILGEGHWLLVTVRVNAENVRCGSGLYFVECPIKRQHDGMPEQLPV